MIVLPQAYYGISIGAITGQGLMQERVRTTGRVASWGERWPAVTTWISLATGAILCIAAALLA